MRCSSQSALPLSSVSRSVSSKIMQCSEPSVQDSMGRHRRYLWARSLQGQVMVSSTELTTAAYTHKSMDHWYFQFAMIQFAFLVCSCSFGLLIGLNWNKLSIWLSIVQLFLYLFLRNHRLTLFPTVNCQKISKCVAGLIYFKLIDYLIRHHESPFRL